MSNKNAEGIKFETLLLEDVNVSKWEGFFAKFFIVFSLQLVVPTNSRFYENIFSAQFWENLNWQTLSSLATSINAPQYWKPEDIWGLESYLSLIIAFFISVAASVVWQLAKPKFKWSDEIFYAVWSFTRYRTALGIIAWGFKKLIPKQMEPPSQTFLETPFIDFSEQKLYWQGVGIAQGYEVFLGLIEVLCGVFLMIRPTVALGAFLTATVLFNIVLANHAYDGMVHVHSATFAVIGFMIFLRYWPYLDKLLFKKENVQLPDFHNVLCSSGKIVSFSLKAIAWGVFVFYSFFLHWQDTLGYRYPHNSPAVKQLTGFYLVDKFVLNGKVLPYDPLDSLRWQDAVFENWSTITYKVNRVQEMDIENTGRETVDPLTKRFEFRGIGGGRHYFHYQADTTLQSLNLVNKNRAHRNETLSLSYEFLVDKNVRLHGTNQNGDSLDIVLTKYEKDYVLNH